MGLADGEDRRRSEKRLKNKMLKKQFKKIISRGMQSKTLKVGNLPFKILKPTGVPAIIVSTKKARIFFHA
jgi:hypothetical protein